MSKNDFKIFNFLVLCIILIGLASAVKNIKIIPSFLQIKETPSPEVTPAKLSYTPQFVLISFDGSKAVSIWKDIREFKDQMNASGTPLNVTHFINAAYFLTNENKDLYQGPHQERGYTNIGVSEDLEHIRTRIEEVNKAIADGDEIAVHTVGHLSGLHWAKEDWLQELESFNAIMFGLDKIYPDAHLPPLNLKATDIIGFRAPYLDHDQNLYEALHELPQYKYDTSEVGDDSEWPTKDTHGLWHIPLGMVELGPNRTHILAMDYNWYLHDTNTKNTLTQGTAEWQRVYENTLKAMLDYFNHNYTGKRAPVLIGYHFSMDWNDGVYWKALKDFAREVCGKPEVKCGTFKELVNYMNEYGTPRR